MNEIILITKGPHETRSLAQRLFSGLPDILTHRSFVIGLQGELGSGKTEFVKGLVSLWSLEKAQQVKSPTFVLLRTLDLSASSRLYHWDLYRLEAPDKDLAELGFLEQTKKQGALIVVEWAERSKLVSSCWDVWIRLFYTPQRKYRKINVKIKEEWKNLPRRSLKNYRKK